MGRYSEYSTLFPDGIPWCIALCGLHPCNDGGRLRAALSRAGGMLWAILCIPASLVDGSGRDVLNSYKRRRGISGGMVDRRLL